MDAVKDGDDTYEYIGISTEEFIDVFDYSYLKN